MGIIAERWLVDEGVHLTVHRATGLRKFTGLIGRPELSDGDALLLANCRAVHGAWMTRTIDVVFVDDAGFVTSVRRLPPWRFIADRPAAHVLELRAGEAFRLGIVAGSQIKRLSEEYE
jgi:uncharacterized membrane protein (UPF0127 family)